MNFYDKYYWLRKGDVAGNILRSYDEGKCTVCGKPTFFIELNSEGYFCSEECERVFDKEHQQYMVDSETSDELVICNPFDIGMCEKCANRVEWSNTKWVCCGNPCGVLTRNCRLVPRCNKFRTK